MKNQPSNRRAFAALIPASLLLATPAFAQEVQLAPAPPVQTVAPPPVVPTIAPPAATVAPPPAETVTPAPEAATPAPVRAAPVRAARTARPAQRTVRTAAPVRAAPVRAAPVEARAPVPVAPAPVDVTPAPVQAPVQAAAPAPAVAADTTQTSTATQSTPIWPWLLGAALVLLGAVAFFVMRRRRVDEEEYYEEPYVEAAAEQAAPIRSEPAPFAPAAEPAFLKAAPIAVAPAVVAPVVVANDGPAPLAAEEAELAEPEVEDVAALTEGTAPVADRPWLEFALRPVRAGTNVDEALVEIELTVGNSGSVAAKDVRISTFMFAAAPANGADMEQMLVDRGSDGVEPVTIEPGEGTRVDATLALSKADLIETTNGSIRPIVVAEARYPLPDGTEGRTSASFTIGVSEEGGPSMAPIQLSERAMHDDVEARLYGVPQHA
jgi:hypothetical protein